jgi:hypothetical protein
MRRTDNDELLWLTCAGNENIDWSRAPARNMNLLWYAAQHDNCDVAAGIVEQGDIIQWHARGERHKRRHGTN